MPNKESPKRGIMDEVNDYIKNSTKEARCNLINKLKNLPESEYQEAYRHGFIDGYDSLFMILFGDSDE